MENERRILEAAIEKINEIAGIELEAVGEGAGNVPGRADTVVWLTHAGRRYKYIAEVKRTVTKSTAHFVAKQLVEYTRKTKTAALLVTDYVTGGVGEILRAMDVQYLDAAGNAHMHAGGVHLLIEGKKRTETGRTRTGGDPFGWAGLKVVFTLLCAEELRNAAYRDIATAAGVALGTVGGVVTELERRKFLMRVGGVAKLRNPKELMQLWVTAYIEKLRPKLLLGRFEAIVGLDTHEAIRYGALLGAETGAMELQKYLKPGIHTLYIEDDQKEFVVKQRLQKHPEGRVELRRKFWKFNYPEKELGVVPPLLIYADLIAVGDPRTIEAAEMIYDECLA
ncbi:MAG: type IV toxin-antitoxin system AbiEi family antitoxin [Bacteroidota bacterium]